MELNDQPSPYMGEVKVQVKLTNLHDAEAAADGTLEVGRVRNVSATGMVDTGAVRSVLPPVQPHSRRPALRSPAGFTH